jgi:Domain of unknown function (DUF1707)
MSLGDGDSVSVRHDGPDLARAEAAKAVILASDADRDAAVRVLNEAFAEGRLTADEHGERVRAAYAGRTWQELAQLTADLPDPAHAADLPGPARAAGRGLIAGAPYGLDLCLLCALLILCPPAGIALLLTARHRSAMDQRHAVTAGGGGPVFAAPDAARARDGWRAEDR